MRALLIPGDYQEVAGVPWKGTLAEVATMFSCQTIEVVKTPIPNLLMLVDEDARLTGKAPNHKAMLFHPGVIFGPALLTYGEMVETTEPDEFDLKFTGIPDGFDFPCVAESSYQRIVASLGEHPIVNLEGSS